jgi:hypothetical protein
MRIAFIGSAVIAALLVAACDGDDGTQSPPADTPAPMDNEGSADVERFVLVGSGRFLVCVQTLEETVSLERAASAIEAGFEVVGDEGGWPGDWDAPAVDRGCPLPPLALTETGKPFLERRVCKEKTSGYLVHLYVGDAARFEERFAGSRLRAAPHEYLARDVSEVPGNAQGEAGSQCFGWVALAWYVTPGELEDHVLRDYVANFIGNLQH